MTIVHENLLRCMSPAERAKLGKAGMTAMESEAKFIARSERDIQSQINNELLRRGIWFTRSAMHKRATNTVGTPDFLFAVNGQACAFEVKFEHGKLRPEQVRTLEQMRANGWRVAVVRSLVEAIEFLRETNPN